MGATKTEIFSAEQNELAMMLKALAHPARIAILQEIIASGTCICGDLVGQFSLAQATISQHLKELKNAGIIKGSVEGPSVCYCIDAGAWKKLKAHLDNLLGSYKVIDQECC